MKEIKSEIKVRKKVKGVKCCRKHKSQMRMRYELGDKVHKTGDKQKWDSHN